MGGNKRKRAEDDDDDDLDDEKTAQTSKCKGATTIPIFLKSKFVGLECCGDAPASFRHVPLAVAVAFRLSPVGLCEVGSFLSLTD